MINVCFNFALKYSFAMGRDLFVMINEDLMDAYDGDEVVTILSKSWIKLV
jgi:hypothetical protein